MKTYKITTDFQIPKNVSYVNPYGFGKDNILPYYKRYYDLEFAALQYVCNEHKTLEQITVRRADGENNIVYFGIIGYGLIIANLDHLHLSEDNTFYWFDSEEEKLQYFREKKLGRICDK